MVEEFSMRSANICAIVPRVMVEHSLKKRKTGQVALFRCCATRLPGTPVRRLHEHLNLRTGGRKLVLQNYLARYKCPVECLLQRQ